MLTFERGKKYSRSQVKERAGLPRDAKGGIWDTGVVEHENEFFIFATGTEAATGHNYENRWENDRLRWSHKRGSHRKWPSVQRLIKPTSRVHIFWRETKYDKFKYAGMGRLVEFFDRSPVEILWSFEESPE